MIMGQVLKTPMRVNTLISPLAGLFAVLSFATTEAEAQRGRGASTPRSDRLRQAQRLDVEGKHTEARVIFQKLIDTNVLAATRSTRTFGLALVWIGVGMLAVGVILLVVVVAVSQPYSGAGLGWGAVAGAVGRAREAAGRWAAWAAALSAARWAAWSSCFSFSRSQRLNISPPMPSTTGRPITMVARSTTLSINSVLSEGFRFPG